MTAEPTYVTEGPPRLVGQVFTEIIIRNSHDAALSRAGRLPPGAVREIILDEVLVDTGATQLALPAQLTERLGLEPIRDVVLSTANGVVTTRLLEGAQLEVAGRRMTTDVLELPEGGRPLLGVVPMQSLGIEPDIQNHRLRLLSESDAETHLYA
jgi:predicted aspartyl protease